MTEMSFWKIRPVAEPHDSRWQNHPIWKEVIVQADTAALARLVAARLEHDPDEPPTGNESPTFRSAFQDEKLYWVVELGPEEAAAVSEAVGGNGIIRALPFPEAERERDTERHF